MRYWMDTEFNEDGKTIDLISIGIVSGDGREYYAVSNEFNPEACNDWVKANVLPLLPPKETWKSRAQIRDEVKEFCSARGQRPEFWSYCADYDWVVFCWLFGAMSKLPDGWPWYCMDIMQLRVGLGYPPMAAKSGAEHDALADARWHKASYDAMRAIELERAEAARDALAALARRG